MCTVLGSQQQHANRRQLLPFQVFLKGRTWNIDSQWLQSQYPIRFQASTGGHKGYDLH